MMENGIMLPSHGRVVMVTSGYIKMESYIIVVFLHKVERSPRDEHLRFEENRI